MNRLLSAPSQRARAAFHARMAELGGTVLEPEWLGSARYHRVRCTEGHEGTAKPNAVQQGGAICHTCRPKLNLHSSPRWHINGRRTAVYRLYDAEDRLLYVGITVNPKSRLRDHRTKKPWWHEVARTETRWFDTRPEAEDVEGVAIRDERPLYDATHRMGGGWRTHESRRGVERNGIYYMREGADCAGCGHQATWHNENAGRCWVAGEAEWLDCQCTTYIDSR